MHMLGYEWMHEACITTASIDVCVNPKTTFILLEYIEDCITVHKSQSIQISFIWLLQAKSQYIK